MLRVIFYIISILFFFCVGSLQFFGASLTLISYTLLICIGVLLFCYFLLRKTFSVNLFMKTNLIFFFIIVISAIINKSHILFICYYLAYIVIPITIYLSCISFVVIFLLPNSEVVYGILKGSYSIS